MTGPETSDIPVRHKSDIPSHDQPNAKTTSFSDIEPARWKEYDDIILDSLWLLGARDKSGPHSNEYWGNFVPQIPQQVIKRFTKRGEAVVDLFAGLGTTLIECKHLGRSGIGVELVPEVAHRAEELVSLAKNPWNVQTRVIAGDSTSPATMAAVRSALQENGFDWADAIILHPPYHDIIKFSGRPDDLSNTPSLEVFLEKFGQVVGHAYSLLRPGRFMALVIGDKYAGGQWIPLGFECMRVCQQAGFILKAINVKDMQGNERGKGKNENLWKYRALKEGFYLFKHEYVMVFRKP